MSEAAAFSSALWNSLLVLFSWSIRPSSFTGRTRRIRLSRLATAVPTLKHTYRQTHKQETKEEKYLGQFIHLIFTLVNIYFWEYEKSLILLPWQHLASLLRGYLHPLYFETNSLSAFVFHMTAWKSSRIIWNLWNLFICHDTYQDDKSQQCLELHLFSTDPGGLVLQWCCLLILKCVPHAIRLKASWNLMRQIVIKQLVK